MSERRSSKAVLNWIRLIVALLVVGGGLVAYRACPAPWWGRGTPAKQRVQLVKVVDGDTLRLRAGGGTELKVRLIGIDTPELGTAASFRSALYAAELLEGAREIWLEPDPRTPTDRYGRTLGWVWVVDEQGAELLLQEELIRAGLADLYRDAEASKYFERLKRLR